MSVMAHDIDAGEDSPGPDPQLGPRQGVLDPVGLRRRQRHAAPGRPEPAQRRAEAVGLPARAGAGVARPARAGRQRLPHRIQRVRTQPAGRQRVTAAQRRPPRAGRPGRDDPRHGAPGRSRGHRHLLPREARRHAQRPRAVEGGRTPAPDVHRLGQAAAGHVAAPRRPARRRRGRATCSGSRPTAPLDHATPATRARHRSASTSWRPSTRRPCSASRASPCRSTTAGRRVIAALSLTVPVSHSGDEAARQHAAARLRRHHPSAHQARDGDDRRVTRARADAVSLTGTGCVSSPAVLCDSDDGRDARQTSPTRAPSRRDDPGVQRARSA